MQYPWLMYQGYFLYFPFKITLILVTQKTSKSFLENALAF